MVEGNIKFVHKMSILICFIETIVNSALFYETNMTPLLVIVTLVSEPVINELRQFIVDFLVVLVISAI